MLINHNSDIMKRSYSPFVLALLCSMIIALVVVSGCTYLNIPGLPGFQAPPTVSPTGSANGTPVSNPAPGSLDVLLVSNGSKDIMAKVKSSGSSDLTGLAGKVFADANFTKVDRSILKKAHSNATNLKMVSAIYGSGPIREKIGANQPSVAGGGTGGTTGVGGRSSLPVQVLQMQGNTFISERAPYDVYTDSDGNGMMIGWWWPIGPNQPVCYLDKNGVRQCPIYIYNVWMGMDVSGIHSPVKKATLTLYETRWWNNQIPEYDNKIIQTISSIWYNTQPVPRGGAGPIDVRNYAKIWVNDISSRGGTSGTAADGSIYQKVNYDDSAGVITIDMTDLVNDWISGKKPNLGIWLFDWPPNTNLIDRSKGDPDFTSEFNVQSFIIEN